MSGKAKVVNCDHFPHYYKYFENFLLVSDQRIKVSLELPFTRWWVQRDLPPAVIEGNAAMKDPEGIIEKSLKLNNMGEATVTFTNEELKKHKFFNVISTIVLIVTEQFN